MGGAQIVFLLSILAFAALAVAAARGSGSITRTLAFLERVDRRWIFLLMGIAVLVPLLRPIGLPLVPSKPVRDFYAVVDQIPAGAVVLISGDYDPGSAAELQPMTLALLDHLFRHNVRVVGMQLWPGGPPLVDRALTLMAEKYKKRYGVDYVNLGFKEGQIITMVALGSSGFRTVYPVDYHGTPTSQIPLMEKVRDYSSFHTIISISAGFPGGKEWVQQVQSRFKKPFGTGTTAIQAAEFYPYLESKQMFGMLGGMAGAAEYESLTKAKGTATAGMDAMSVAHFLIIAAIVLGNIAFIGRRAAERRMREES
jgi:hypothetical protein